MPAGTVNSDLTLIPDQAEVWIQLKSSVTDITTEFPTAPDSDLAALGWLFVGYIDDKKGIPIDPSVEIKEYDAFGYPKFRKKIRNGDLKTGFTVLESNAVTKKIVLPGSASNKIGIPKDVQIYVLYKFVDEDRATVWVQLRPAPVEVKSHGGIVDGELSWAELTVHHTTDANRDVFHIIDWTSDDVHKTFTIAAGVTAYTATVSGSTTTSIATKTAAALQAALRALAPVAALPSPGATVTGPDGGPLVVTFTSTVSGVSATGTGGTVTVA